MKDRMLHSRKVLVYLIRADFTSKGQTYQGMIGRIKYFYLRVADLKVR